MSSGTVQQLSSKGVQDGHLSISPETSFWKRSYKRVANFAVESINTEITGAAWGKTSTTIIQRNGDLLTDMWLYLEVELLDLAAPAGDSVYWTNVLGHAAVQTASLEVGNNQIDHVTSEFLEVLHEVGSSVDIDVDELVLRADSVAQLTEWSMNGNTTDVSGSDEVQLFVKLPFYFSQARSQAMPIIALQYHDVRVKLTLRSQANLVIYSNASNTTLSSTSTGAIKSGAYMCNFAFLDSMERRLFAANAHEYLIRNLQTAEFSKAAGSSGARVNATVIFNHPVLSFFWFARTAANETANEYFNWECTPGAGDDGLTSATIKFNGSERETARGPLYFRVLQPAKYMDRTPRRPLYNYNFAEMPLSWFPSGSVNLSRIDTTSLDIRFRSTDADGNSYGIADVFVYAMSFNVVRIQGGMMAKKYAN